MITRINQTHPAVVYGLLAVLMAAVFVPMSLFRLVDGDEGTYLLVSRLVAEGQLPYHDFYYPQMFLLPYVYGAWMKLVGYSWYGARVLSALLSIALGLLVCRQTAHLAGARAWGVLAAVLLTFTSLAFGWYPLIKTFVLPTLLLFAAYVVISSHSTRWKWVASGFLLGLAVACRLYVIAVTPAFLLEIYLTEKALKPRLMQLAGFTIGLVIALLPTELFFLIGPETFIFNVVGSQVIRTDYTALSWWQQKISAPMTLLAINSGERVISIQFLLFLFPLNLGSWISSAVSRERLTLASSIAILLILASFIPTPVYTQYFCMPLPFLMVNAVVFCASLTRDVSAPQLRHFFASLATLYVLLSPYDFYRYTIGGEQMPGSLVYADAVNWQLPTIRAVGQAIDRELRPDRPFAISFWPGYLVETKAAILPGTENHFALMFADRVTPSEIVQFKLMSYPRLLWHVQRHTVDVIVLGNWTPDKSSVREQLAQSGYTLRERIAKTEIYTLPVKTSRP